MTTEMLQIDFHAHILPGADHGSDGLATSLRQVALAREAGIDLLIATPHFYPHLESPWAFLERRAETWACLREALPADAPQLRIGAEVQLCRGLDRMTDLEQLCVEGTRVLLLELPRDFSVRAYEQTLDALLYERKLTVVLAHVDRCVPGTVDFLLELGFLAQVNAAPFCRLRSRKAALHRAESVQTVALGSDIHGVATGYTEFLQMKRRLGPTYDAVMARTAALLGL